LKRCQHLTVPQKKNCQDLNFKKLKKKKDVDKYGNVLLYGDFSFVVEKPTSTLVFSLIVVRRHHLQMGTRLEGKNNIAFSTSVSSASLQS